MTKKSNKGLSSKTKRILLIGGGSLVILGGILAYVGYTNFITANINPAIKKDTYIFIKTGSNFEDVKKMLVEKNILLSASSFDFASSLLGYKTNIHPGRYLVRPHSNNKNLIRLLKSGIQVPYKLSFAGVHSKYDLAGKISQQLETDSSAIIKVIDNSVFQNKYYLDTSNVLTFFIADSTAFYYTTNTQQFMDDMKKISDNFWNEENRSKAKSLGLSQAQVSILASIIEKETSKDSEKPMVAGLYINRLKKKGWKLEADPTVIFALGDFTKQRVYNIDLEVNSPYNTYKYEGLPPGPICIPSASSITAVLNYTHHDYMYMCAKEDFSGFHNFAKTLAEHKLNAKRYYAELKRRNIH